MVTTSGNSITITQGETLDVAITVYTSAGVAADVTGATAKFLYQQTGYDALTKTCTVASPVITASFTSAETALMLGVYKYEVKAKNVSNEVSVVGSGVITVLQSLDADAV
jgi:predicted aconitase